MYIEVELNTAGDITACWVADTLPKAGGDKPLVIYGEGLPAGHEMVRASVDTVTAMAIEEACKEQAVIDPVTKKPKIQQLDRAEYIVNNFRVDMAKNIHIPASIKLPKGMKMRGLIARI